MKKAVKRSSTNRSSNDISPVNSDLKLGAQIRRIRQMKGMRLRDLSEGCGLSESLISRIENDKTTPSLHTLHHLAKSLDLTVAELLSEQPIESNIVMRGGQRRTIGKGHYGGNQPEGIEAEVMVPIGQKSSLQGFLVRLRPGASTSGARQHEGEEIGYVVRGELLLTVAGITHHLYSGDSFFFLSRLEHDYSNPGTTVTEVVWINTPATF